MVRSKRQQRALVMIMALIISFVPLRSIHANDYGDSPTASQDRAIDIGDLYFFLDPNDNSFAIIAVTIGGYIVPSQNANLGFFGENVRVHFEVENTGDATPDRFIDLTFSKQTSRTAQQIATITLPPVPSVLPNGRQFTAPTTVSRAAFGPQGSPTFGGGTSAQQTSTVTTDGTSGVSFFGGLIDEPCFYDLGAELAYRASRQANQINPAILTRGRDSFAGYNTMVVTLRVPINLLKGSAGNKVGLSVDLQRRAPTSFTRDGRSASFGRYVTLDRMGHPFVNTIMTSYNKKEIYNRSNPQRDATNADGLATDIDANLQALQVTPPFITIIHNLMVTNGDYLRLDTSIPNTGTEGGKNPEAAYPNGRRPNDDVVDTILTLINNGAFQSDSVNDNDLPMRDAFPFFAQPHMPFPPGAGAEDNTRN